MAWNSRFKAASAARRKAANSTPKNQPDRVTADEIARARQVSPAAFLSRHFADVRVNKRGDSIEVDGSLRSDLKNGTWVSCDWHSAAVGDNIALATWVDPELEFRDAVRELLGLANSAQPVVTKFRAAPTELPQFPQVPPAAGEALGRQYLKGRGISDAIIDAAVAAGALSWCQGGVLFLGRDHGDAARPVRAATIRYFEPTAATDGKVVSKRDLANSDKSFPVLFLGDPTHVVVAEGGVSGLAIQEMADLERRPAPTVIVTGGANIRGWLNENQPLRVMVRAADYIAVMAENEVDRDGRPAPLKQTRTDAARQQLARLIAQARDGEVPDIVYPPDGIKDAAEWLQTLLQTIERH
jgi:hypothetical protein